MFFDFPNGVSQLDCILRIALAGLFGAIIGFERSKRQKGAGIRTHIIVALGATLMMVVSKYGFFDMLPFPNDSFSGDRVAANIITGVGFLGAGMIFFRGNSVKGLTTAAGIWTTAGVGLAVGAGLYLLAATTTLLILIIQVLLHKWKIGSDTQVFGEVVLESENEVAPIDTAEAILSETGIEILSTRFKKLNDGRIKLTYQVRAAEEFDAVRSAELSKRIPEITMIEIHGDR